MPTALEEKKYKGIEPASVTAPPPTEARVYKGIEPTRATAATPAESRVYKGIEPAQNLTEGLYGKAARGEQGMGGYVKELAGDVARAVPRMAIDTAGALTSVGGALVEGITKPIGLISEAAGGKDVSEVLADPLYKKGAEISKFAQEKFPRTAPSLFMDEPGMGRPSLLTGYKSGEYSGKDVALALPRTALETGGELIGLAGWLKLFNLGAKAAMGAKAAKTVAKGGRAAEKITKGADKWGKKIALAEAAKEAPKGASKIAIRRQAVKKFQAMKDSGKLVAGHTGHRAFIHGTGVGMGLVEGGGMAGESYERTGDVNPYTAVPLGIAAGYVETIGGAFGMLEKYLGGKEIKAVKALMKSAEETTDPGMMKHIAAQLAQYVGRALQIGGGEAAQEITQEALAVTNLALTEEGFEVFTQENLLRLAESGGRGALLGPFTSLGGIRTRRGQRVEAAAKEESTWRQEVEDQAPDPDEETGEPPPDEPGAEPPPPGEEPPPGEPEAPIDALEPSEPIGEPPPEGEVPPEAAPDVSIDALEPGTPLEEPVAGAELIMDGKTDEAASHVLEGIEKGRWTAQDIEHHLGNAAAGIAGERMKELTGEERKAMRDSLPDSAKEVKKILAAVKEATTPTIDEAAQEAEPVPTEAQKEAGNYKMGHVKVHGFDISIENPAGSERSGTDKDGESWSITMQNHYGYIKGTKGKDKDHIDVFLADVANPEESPNVFVVNQVEPGTKKFDEHKVIMGATTEEEARQTYLANYEEGWQGIGSVSSMTVDEFKGWLKKGSKQKPAPLPKAKKPISYGTETSDWLWQRVRAFGGLRRTMELNDMNLSDSYMKKLKKPKSEGFSFDELAPELGFETGADLLEALDMEDRGGRPLYAEEVSPAEERAYHEREREPSQEEMKDALEEERESRLAQQEAAGEIKPGEDLRLKVGDKVRVGGEIHKVIERGDGEWTLQNGEKITVDDHWDLLPPDAKVVERAGEAEPEVSAVEEKPATPPAPDFELTPSKESKKSKRAAAPKQQDLGLDLGQAEEPEGKVAAKEDQAEKKEGLFAPKEKEQLEIDAEEKEQPPAKKPAPAKKEPWQMTREEFVSLKREQLEEKARYKGAKTGKPYVNKSLMSRAKSEDFGHSLGPIHRTTIEKALSEGKPVPAEVLKDYPDLKPTKEKKPTAKAAPKKEERLPPQPATKANLKRAFNLTDAQAAVVDKIIELLGLVRSKIMIGRGEPGKRALRQAAGKQGDVITKRLRKLPIAKSLKEARMIDLDGKVYGAIGMKHKDMLGSQAAVSDAVDSGRIKIPSDAWKFAETIILLGAPPTQKQANSLGKLIKEAPGMVMIEVPGGKFFMGRDAIKDARAWFDGKRTPVITGVQARRTLYQRKQSRQPDRFGLYSHLERTIEDKVQAKKAIPPKQFLEAIKKAGIKRLELSNTGIVKWLEGKKMVTKAEVMEYLQQKRVKIKPVVRTDEGATGAAARARKRVADGERALTNALQLGADLEEGDIDITIDNIHAGDTADSVMDGLRENFSIEDSDDTIYDRLVALAAASEDLAIISPETLSPKHASEGYRLPGPQENYREHIETVEGIAQEPSPQFLEWYKKKQGSFGDKFAWESLSSEQQNNQMMAYRNEQGESPYSARTDTYTSSHFPDEKNPIYHTREDDRTIDGTDARFVEELQSDWAQEARRIQKEEAAKLVRSEGISMKEAMKRVPADVGMRGKKPFTPEEVELVETASTGDYAITLKNGLVIEGMNQIQDSDRTTKQYKDRIVSEYLEAYKKPALPRTPYPATSDWVPLAMKRILFRAVQDGKRMVAWTTGVQQAERWSNDLRQKVSKITWYRFDGSAAEKEIADTWDKKPPEIGQVVITAHGAGKRTLHFDPEGLSLETHAINQTEPARKITLEELVGKELATKIATSKKSSGKFEGDDLYIGASGFQGFYDEIMVNEMNKLVKKWGGKVGTGEVGTGKIKEGQAPDAIKNILVEEDLLGFDRRADAYRAILKHDDWASRWEVSPENERQIQAWKNSVTAGETVHTLEITDDIADAVMAEGFTYYQGPNKGATEFVEDGKSILYGFESADLSTGLHELGHITRAQLLNRSIPVEQRQGVTDDDITTVEKFVGVKPGKVWTVEQEEKFARAWERYLYDGKHPNKKLEAVLQKLSYWLQKIYTTLKGSDIDVNISPEMRGVFDKLVERSALLEKEQKKAAKAARDIKIPALDDVEYLSYADLKMVAAKLGIKGDFVKERDLQKKVIDKLMAQEMKIDYGEKKGTGAAADMGGYAKRVRTALGLPELVELAKRISSGKVPSVMKWLKDRKSQVRTLGQFKHRPGDVESGAIDLQADIFLGQEIASAFVKGKGSARAFEAFKEQILDDIESGKIPGVDPENVVFKKEWNKKKKSMHLLAYDKDETLAPKVLGHEIGHLVDFLPDAELKRGNLLGRIASLKKHLKATMPGEPGGPGELTAKDRRRLQAEARKLIAAEKALEEGKEVKEETTGVKPEDIIAIWNNLQGGEKNPALLRIIKEMSNLEKSSVVKEAFKGKVPDSIQAKMAAFKKDPSAGAIDFTAREIEILTELMEKEIEKRGLLRNEQINKELRAVTQAWKPFDDLAEDPGYTTYRYSGKELYADAFSVLLNEPALLQRLAPKFYRGLFSYLETKPEVKAAYDEIQERMGNPDAMAGERMANIEEMVAKDPRKAAEEKKREVKEKALTGLRRVLIDGNTHTLDLLGRVKKLGVKAAETARKVQYTIEALQYTATELEAKLYVLTKRVTQKMIDQKVSVNEMGVYKFLRRVGWGDRQDLGNPLGHNRSSARKLMEKYKEKWGPEKFAKIEALNKEFRKWYEKEIIDFVVESGFVSEALGNRMMEEQDYATWNVQHYFDEQHGSGTGGRIYRQVGTLAEVENPFIATIVQAQSLYRAVTINNAKKELLEAMILDGAATPAEMKTVEGVRVPDEWKIPEDQALYTVMVKGKPEHYYVPQVIAKSWEYMPIQADGLMKIWNNASSVVRQVLVSKNPLWMVRNIPRDFRTTIKNIPEVKLRKIPELIGYYMRTAVEVKKYAFTGEMSPLIEEMARGKMITSNRAYGAREVTGESELERKGEEFQLNLTEANQAQRGIRAHQKFLKFLEHAGRTSEIWNKAAGYQFLKAQGTRGEAEIGHIVRTRIGTPDYMRRGDWQNITNNLFLFSNVNKEGIRAAWESAVEDPWAYAWKTMALNVAPKVAILAAAAGLWGDDLEEILAGITEYDKANYTIIPLGMTPEGKSVYLRIPEDYEGQFWGHLSYKLLQKKVGGKEGIFAAATEQVPWGTHKLHPYIQLAMDYSAYYLRGINPVDSYRGRHVLTPDEYRLGGWEAGKKMLKHGWKSLGGSPFYNPPYNELVKREQAWEKALKMPGLNVFGAFLKISDYGMGQEAYNIEDKKEKMATRKRAEINRRIIAKVNAAGGEMRDADVGKLLNELKTEGLEKRETTFVQFRKKYAKPASRAENNPMVNAFNSLQRNDAKEEYAQYVKDTVSPERYAEFKRILWANHHITSKSRIRLP